MPISFSEFFIEREKHNYNERINKEKQRRKWRVIRNFTVRLGKRVD